MLSSIEITRFRCLGSVNVPLKPLTVLIGPNDSGKSAFLAAIDKVLNGQVPNAEGDQWRGDRNVMAQIRAYTLEDGVCITTSGGKPSNSATPNHSLPVQAFQFPSHGVVMESDGHNDDSGQPLISRDGLNVPTLLDYFLRQDLQRFTDTVAALRGLIPGFENLKIATTHPARRRLDLVIEDGYKFPADRASAGVRLLITFVALAYQQTAPKTILLEEPENGIHPKRLADVFNLLRDITEGKHGNHPAQVILTTHSPYLLDLVKPETDQVLVFKRLDDGSRTATPANTDRLAEFLKEFMFGEVWYNLGEEGLTAQ